MNKLTFLRSAIVVLLFGVCLQQVITLLVRFINNEKWSSVSKTEGHYAMEMPQVTVCNYNQIDAIAAAKHGFREDDLLVDLIKGSHLESRWYAISKTFAGKVRLQDLMFRTIIMNQKYDPVGLISIDQLKPEANNSNVNSAVLEQFGIDLYSAYRDKRRTNYSAIVKQLAHGCTDSMVRCLRGDKSFDCCGRSEHVLTQMGVCTRLDSSHHYQYSIGTGGGFRLLYKVATDRFMENVIDAYLESGMMLMLGYGQNITYDISIQPGVKALVKLEQLEDRLSNADSSFFAPPCSRDKMTLNYKFDYNRRNCQYDCLYKATLEICGCMMSTFPIETMRCEPDQWLPCRTGNLTKLTQPNSTAEIKRNKVFISCWASCLQPCEQVRVRASVTTTLFPASHQVENIARLLGLDQVSAKYLRSNFIFLDIYFDNFVIQVNSHYPIATFNDLMSLIGGQMGLWIGASFISLLDCFPVIYNLFGKKCVSERSTEKLAVLKADSWM